MPQKQRFAVALRGMAPGCVKGPPPVKLVVPGNGMMLPVGAAAVAALIQCSQHFYRGIKVFEVVPFVRPLPATG